ncbi:MAG: hypothetical protein VKP72_01595 [bacterium]|nr:hypothetical protein [bacterium]
MSEPSVLVAIARELVRDPGLQAELEATLLQRGIQLDPAEILALRQLVALPASDDDVERQAWTSASRGPREGC